MTRQVDFQATDFSKTAQKTAEDVWLDMSQPHSIRMLGRGHGIRKWWPNNSKLPKCVVVDHDDWLTNWTRLSGYLEREDLVLSNRIAVNVVTETGDVKVMEISEKLGDNFYRKNPETGKAMPPGGKDSYWYSITPTGVGIKRRYAVDELRVSVLTSEEIAVLKPKMHDIPKLYPTSSIEDILAKLR